MRRLFIAVLTVTPLFSMAQKNDQVWALGDFDNIAITFTDSIPIADSLHSGLIYFFTSSNICDSSGDLLFYTNGRLVMNRNGDTMKNGSNLSPQLREFVDWYYDPYIGFQNPQGAISLPKPGSDSLYYLFAVDYDSVLWQQGGIARPYYLTLNVIDMSADSGLGELVVKNQQLFSDTMASAGMTACKHANGRDWWLIRNEYLTNCYYVWLVGPDSIQGPSKQCVGLAIDVNDGNSNLEFSPNGKNFALQVALSINDIALEVMDFDRCSGELSNPIVIDVPDSLELGVFGGVEFSSDSRFLYGFTTDVIYQADLDTTDTPASLTKVAQWIFSDTTYGYFNDWQLAPDGKIYIQGVFCNPALSVINNPNAKGIACNVTLQNFALPTLGACGIPNMPNYQLGALQGSLCDTLTNANYWTQSEEVKSLRVIPNPNDGRFTVSYQLPQNKEGMLTITNQLGEVVYRERRPQWSSLCSINVSGLADGLYLVTIESNGKRKSVKFIKE